MMTQEQIAREFERQVYLCSGLGKEQMLATVEKYFDVVNAHGCKPSEDVCLQHDEPLVNGARCRRGKK